MLFERRQEITTTNKQNKTGCRLESQGIWSRLSLIFSAMYYSIVIVCRHGGIASSGIIALLSIINGLLPAVSIYITKLVLDAIGQLILTGYTDTTLRSLAIALSLQLSVHIVSSIAKRTNQFVSYVVGRRVALAMEGGILKKLPDFELRYFEDAEFYDQMTRAKRESSVKPLMLITKINTIVSSSIVLVSMSAIVIHLSSLLFIAMVCVALPLVFVRVKYGEKRYALEYSRTEDKRKAGYLSHVMTDRRIIPEIIS